jgi:[NiFe] hydrogenase assembly HybE family chaperone
MASSPAERLRATFEAIHRERMAGLPILNPRLSVTVVEGRDWRGERIDALVTPWCLNLIATPLDPSGLEPQPIGTARVIPFPAGRIEFLVSEEPGIGPFAACSLFSPMGDFSDQETAVATARAVLDALFEPEFEPEVLNAPDPRPAGEPVAGGRGAISRRELLRGRFSRT